MTICSKCKYCWSCDGKIYCNSINGNTTYSKNKKQCKNFEEGQNYKKYRKKDGKNRNPKKFW